MAQTPTYSSMRQFAGIALEATPGTPVAMTNTLLPEKITWDDKPKWLDDKGMRGWMTSVYGRQIGPIVNEFGLDGPVFGDTLPFILANLFGDCVPTGTTTTPTTTLSASSTAGASSITTVATIPAGTTILIDTGNLAEVRKTGTPSGAGPYTIPLAAGATPLAYAHASAVTVTAVTAPFTHAFAVLNSGATGPYQQGQPPTHTVTHYSGVTPSVGARQFSGACCSDLELTFNAETELLMMTSKWTSWPSVAAGALPVSAPSAVLPIASWRGAIGLGGPATGGTLVKAVPSGKITFKRKLEPDFTVSGVQTPYIIQRGELDISGELEIIAADESGLNYMLNNTQPQFQFLLDNGVVGAGDIKVQVDCQQTAFNAATMDSSKANIRYKLTFDALANTTNAGGSGGGSPGKVTITNALGSNTYL